MRKEIGLKNRKTKRKIMTSPGLEPGTLSVLDSRDKTNYTNQPCCFLDYYKPAFILKYGPVVIHQLANSYLDAFLYNLLWPTV